MPSKRDIESAWEIAERYIESMEPTDPKLWRMLDIGKRPTPSNAGLVWWDDATPLFEVPLFTPDDRPSGYLLVSIDRRFPPVIEFATEGDPLTTQIDSLAVPALSISGVSRPIDRRYFLSSTEFVIRVRPKPRASSTMFVLLPTMGAVEASVNPISRSTRGVFSPVDVRDEWDAIRSRTPGAPGNKPKVVLKNALPVRYQQNCSKYNLTNLCTIAVGSGNDHYCSPNAIAGCVPVAWAMLLSAWKRTGHFDSAKIWKNSSCWSIEWPSWGGWANPSQCRDVERTVWRLHKLMNTTSGGSTKDSDTMRGAAIFSEMGLKWRFGSRTNQKFEFIRKVISAGQPSLFTGVGKWSAFAQKLGVKGVAPSAGKVGHGVVAYGYQKKGQKILVALGWGTSYSNKWITYNQYGSTRVAFLTGTSAASTGTAPISVDS